MKTQLVFISLIVTLATVGCASAQSAPIQTGRGRVVPMLAARAGDACTVASTPRAVREGGTPTACVATTQATGRGAYHASKSVAISGLSLLRTRAARR